MGRFVLLEAGMRQIDSTKKLFYKPRIVVFKVGATPLLCDVGSDGRTHDGSSTGYAVETTPWTVSCLTTRHLGMKKAELAFLGKDSSALEAAEGVGCDEVGLCWRSGDY